MRLRILHEQFNTYVLQSKCECCRVLRREIKQRKSVNAAVKIHLFCSLSRVVVCARLIYAQCYLQGGNKSYGFVEATFLTVYRYTLWSTALPGAQASWWVFLTSKILPPVAFRPTIDTGLQNINWSSMKFLLQSQIWGLCHEHGVVKGLLQVGRYILLQPCLCLLSRGVLRLPKFSMQCTRYIKSEMSWGYVNTPGILSGSQTTSPFW